MSEDKTQFEKNKEFIESYRLKGDGSIADQFAAGCKKFFSEYVEPTEEERAEYRAKMNTIVGLCMRSGLWGNKKEQPHE